MVHITLYGIDNYAAIHLILLLDFHGNMIIVNLCL